MSPSAITLVALLALAAHVASLVVLLQGRDASFDAERRLAEVRESFESDQATAAVERWCSSLAPRTPARRLLLFALGVELAETPVDTTDTDYRTAPAAASRPASVAPILDAEHAALRKGLLRHAGAAVGSGLSASAAGIASLSSGTDRWGGATMSIGTFGAIGVVVALAETRKLLGALALVHQRAPTLVVRPAGATSEDRKVAARRAREELAATPTAVSVPLVVAAMTFSIMVAVWAAWQTGR